MGICEQKVEKRELRIASARILIGFEWRGRVVALG